MSRLKFTRLLQVGFLVLLGVCTAQLTYWLADEVAYTAAVRTQLRAAYGADAEAAQVMLREGSRWSKLSATYPDLTIGPDSIIAVKPSALAASDAQRFHRLNRYADANSRRPAIPSCAPPRRSFQSSCGRES